MFDDVFWRGFGEGISEGVDLWNLARIIRQTKIGGAIMKKNNLSALSLLSPIAKVCIYLLNFNVRE